MIWKVLPLTEGNTEEIPVWGLYADPVLREKKDPLLGSWLRLWEKYLLTECQGLKKAVRRDGDWSERQRRCEEALEGIREILKECEKYGDGSGNL